MLWARYPFLRFTLALVFGILANNVFRSTEAAYCLLLYFVVGISVFIYWKSNWSSNKNPRITIGIFAISTIILLGFLVSQFNYQSSLPTMNMKDFKLTSRFLVKINSRPVKTTKTIKFEVLVEKSLVSNKWYDCEESAILYFSGTKKDELKFGDRLLINGNLKPFQRQTNPHAFNYAEYMQRQRIYLQSYVTSADFLQVDNDHGYSL